MAQAKSSVTTTKDNTAPAEGPRDEGVQDPRVVAVDGADAALADAPDSPNKGGKLVKVLYPTNNFVIEGIPVVTSDGTRLSAADAKTVMDLARVNGVRVVEVEESN